MVDDTDAVRADHQEREAIHVLDAVSHHYTVHSGLRGVSYCLPHCGSAPESEGHDLRRTRYLLC